MESLIQYSSLAIVTLDEGHTIISCNRDFERLFQYKESEIIGKNLDEVIAGQEYLQDAMSYTKETLDGKAIHGSGARERKDGSPIEVEFFGVPVVIEGKVVGAYAIYRDITERRQAEEALRESEEFSSSLMENSPTPILVVNPDTSIKYVNPMLKELTGYTSAEIIGKKAPYPWWTANPEPGDVSEWKKDIRTVVRGREKLFRKNNGEQFWVEITSTPITPNGEFKYALTNWVDITERKRAEEEKQNLVAQLVRAQKMEAIGTLAGGVAHDLNNILSGLVSYPELLLLDLPKDSPLRQPIVTIQNSGQKATAIVQNLLTLARRGVAATEVVNLTSIVSKYLISPECGTLRRFHPNVKLETDFETDLLPILGSPVHLSETVMNLVSNAAEAMPHGGEIFISTENRYIDQPIRGYDPVEEGDYVTLIVSDTGVGIPQKDIEKIFEPFYTKKVMGRSGTGLGMAVVWGTVKDHKGYIDVKSTEGKGTTFTLYFPVTRKESAKDESRLSIDDYRGTGESILVVDDMEEQREIAAQVLKRLGYSVTSVSSGEEAVDYMKDNSADLLVLDMIMDPGIDGLETYKRILELRPGQKAIIVSGFSETERVREAQRLGAGAYVKKPYLLEKFGLAVRDELER